MVQLTICEILLARLYTSLPLIGLDDQFNALTLLISETINKGKGNSAILQGPTGSGKTRLIQKIISDLKQSNEVVHPKKHPLIQTQFYTIFLDGIVHTDDKVALHSIIRQLHLNQEAQDAGNTGSFADRLRFMLTTLAKGGESSTPIVFILDRFDMFATHTNQILLYNLFDIAQSQQTPICVIGVSGKLDSTAMLEKRVKSRFSHRVIDVYPPESLESFLDIARSALLLQEGENPSDANRDKYNKHVQDFLSNPLIIEEIQYVYTTYRHVPSLLQICSHTIQDITFDNPKLSVDSFIEYSMFLKKDHKCGLIQNLCILELGLLDCIKKYITRLRDGQTPMPNFNFEIVYDEYQKMVYSVSRMGHGSHGLHFKKAVILKAFEQLESIKLIKFEGGMTANVPKEYRMARSLLTVEQIEEGLQNITLPQALRKWIQTK